MSSAISKSANLFDYFRDRVERAERECDVRLSPDTSLYLANLLSDRARADRPAQTDQLTLAELHAQAAGAIPSVQCRTYRELGDRSLYQLGYFRESLSGKIVSVSYYEEMGAAAYHRVDSVLKRWFSDAFGPVFTELASSFHECTQVLTHIRDVDQVHGDARALTNKWLATGGERWASLLEDRGMLIGDEGT